MSSKNYSPQMDADERGLGRERFKLNEEMDNKIKKAFERKNIIWRKHALIRMMERDIPRKDVFNAISNGKIIETYPDIKPYPGYLMFGQVDEKMLHIPKLSDCRGCRIYKGNAFPL